MGAGVGVSGETYKSCFILVRKSALIGCIAAAGGAGGLGQLLAATTELLAQLESAALAISQQIAVVSFGLRLLGGGLLGELLDGMVHVSFALAVGVGLLGQGLGMLLALGVPLGGYVVAPGDVAGAEDGGDTGEGEAGHGEVFDPARHQALLV